MNVESGFNEILFALNEKLFLKSVEERFQPYTEGTSSVSPPYAGVKSQLPHDNSAGLPSRGIHNCTR